MKIGETNHLNVPRARVLNLVNVLSAPLEGCSGAAPPLPPAPREAQKEPDAATVTEPVRAEAPRHESRGEEGIYGGGEWEGWGGAVRVRYA